MCTAQRDCSGLYLVPNIQYRLQRDCHQEEHASSGQSFGRTQSDHAEQRARVLNCCSVVGPTPTVLERGRALAPSKNNQCETSDVLKQLQ